MSAKLAGTMVSKIGGAKAVAHWGLKGLTILYQIGTKSVPKSVGSFFSRGASMENVKYVP